MEIRRWLIFFIFLMSSLSLLQQWEKANAPIKPILTSAQSHEAYDLGQSPVQSGSETRALPKGERIKVITDRIVAEIDTHGGDIRYLALLKHKASVEGKDPFVLMQDGNDRTYVAQSGFMDENKLPTHNTQYTADAKQYVLTPDLDVLRIKLNAPSKNGISVQKILTFKRNSYLIDESFYIKNNSGETISPVAYFRMLHDGKEPKSNVQFVDTFNGATVFTQQHKFQKVSFSDIEKGKDNFVQNCDNGWVGLVQHYFVSLWITPNPNKVYSESCGKNPDRRYELRKLPNGLYSVGVILNGGKILNGENKYFGMSLFSGPEEYKALTEVDDSLVLTKDYGIFAIVATPLFWVLVKIHALVGNWGWAIILLTVLLKLIFYYPSAASYRSMAKMRDLAPRLQKLKEQYGEDRQKFQQAMLELYKTEKINPLGGCLPVLIQVPVFAGLYWVLLSSVELRQAPWLGWIQDLSSPDPYYIIPVILAILIWYQSTLTPPPADPMQAKMMKFMPIAFSIFFFFSPSGLELYWLVNNILSIAQQKLIYRQLAHPPLKRVQAK